MKSERETSGLSAGNYQVVAWDLDTTGRRLIDEICQIAGHYSTSTSGSVTTQSDRSFSQYVMPHRNPNPGARRSFGIKVNLNQELNVIDLPRSTLFLYYWSQQGVNKIRAYSCQFIDLL